MVPYVQLVKALDLVIQSGSMLVYLLISWLDLDINLLSAVLVLDVSARLCGLYGLQHTALLVRNLCTLHL